MTTRFVSAAELMSRVLGANDYSFVVIDHPISSATAEELGRQARVAATALANLLVEPTA